MVQQMDYISQYYSTYDLSELQKLTLIIPTYNRNFYLSQCLWYHAHFPFSEIIVADSSPEEKRVINRKIVKGLCKQYSANISYYEYDFPAEEYGGEIYRKWGDASSKVKTEYVVSCTDKEFLLPATLCNSVKFLEANPEYSIADGIYYIINSNKYLTQWQRIKSFLSEDTADRRKPLTEYVASIQFAVQRTKNYYDIFQQIAQYNLYDIRFGETIIETLPIIHGKTWREVKQITSLRDLLPSTHVNKRSVSKYIKNESSYSRYPMYSDYPDARKLEYSQRLEKCLSNNLGDDVNNISFEFVKKLMNTRYPEFPPTLVNKLRKLPQFRYICNTLLPYCIIKKISSSLFNAETYPIAKIEEYSEMGLILAIVRNTEKYHDNDEPIPECGWR